MAKTASKKMPTKDHALDRVQKIVDKLRINENSRFLAIVCSVDENDLMQTNTTTWMFPNVLFNDVMDKIEEFANQGGDHPVVRRPTMLRPADIKEISSLIDKRITHFINEASEEPNPAFLEGPK